MATNGYLTDELSKKTSLLGLKLWVVLGIGVGGFIVIILFALAIWLFSRKKCRNSSDEKLPVHIIPNVSKEIQEVQIDKRGAPSFFHPSSLMQPKSSGSGEKAAEKVVVHVDATKVETNYNLIAGKKFGAPETTPAYVMQSLSRYDTPDRALGSPAITASDRALGSPAISVSDEKKAGIQMECAERVSHGSLSSRSLDSPAPGSSEVSHLGWGHWYTLKDLEAATNCFSESNVVGEGGYGIVFKGQVQDGGMIAVKNLLNNKGQAEKEFRVEVEAIGRVRHKNLVRLLGYCAEGAHRMLVYEYVNNGNLDQWLHGPLARSNSLSWDARMKIVLGTAKALAYLHEALEPKVVHRDIKSSNILIDTHYNAKISDFGLAKLLGSEKSHVTTRVMGTFGYVAPEYANTGLLNECSDVYSFGVLLMEVITGRDPVDYSRTPGEVNLVDWLKLMVGNRRSEEVADPNLKEKPTPRALKRALLIALRCVDPDSSRRPKMGHVVHMLEAEDFPFKDDRRVRDGGRQKQVDAQRPPILSRKNGGPTLDDDDDTDGFDSPNKNYKAKQWRRYEG